MSMYARGSCCVRACVCLQADRFQEVQRGVENMLFEVSLRRKLRLLEEKQVRAKDPRAPSTTVSYGLYKKNKKIKNTIFCLVHQCGWIQADLHKYKKFVIEQLRRFLYLS